MKITKRQLKRLIREETVRLLGECPNEGSDMPCPIRTASEMRAAGATDSDVLHWVQLLISEFAGGTQEVVTDDEFSFTGDVGELPGDEAFAVGYEAGTGGLA